jgi:polysaccharide export outer membrane protein
MVVLTAGGCMHAAAPPGPTDAAKVPQVAPSDLDSLAYARHLPKPKAVQAQVLVQAPPQLQVQPAAHDAHAEAVIPVAADFPESRVYSLDTGDKLRIVVFGQDGLSNSYFVDAAGQITMPLIGAVTARGLTTQQLSRAVATKLKNGFIREPHVAIEVEVYRPFFILGEVTQPGQYPYVPNMTVETAVAIAGGFTPRAYRWDIEIERPVAGGVVRQAVPPIERVRPGDTIVVRERWF